MNREDRDAHLDMLGEGPLAKKAAVPYTPEPVVFAPRLREDASLEEIKVYRARWAREKKS
jgi:hypothetical protein